MSENQLSIVTYHAIDDRESVLSVSPVLFRRQMEVLAEHDLTGISLTSAFKGYTESGHFPHRCVVLTFDDGYLSVFEQALPVMKALGYSGTAFISTDFVGMSATQAKQLNSDFDRDVMDWAHIEKLEESGFEIGAHSMSHSDLRKLPASDVETELGTARKILDKRLQQPVQSFAYPYGYYNQGLRDSVAKYYRQACTTQLGHNQQDSDALLQKRLDVYYLKNELTFLRACQGGLGVWWGLRQALRKIKTLSS